MKSSFDEIMSFSPDGFLISNGPGDPSAMKDVIKLVKRITHSKNQFLALPRASNSSIVWGISTFKCITDIEE